MNLSPIKKRAFYISLITSLAYLLLKDDISQQQEVTSKNKNEIVKSIIEKARTIHPLARMAEQLLQ